MTYQFLSIGHIFKTVSKPSFQKQSTRKSNPHSLTVTILFTYWYRTNVR